MSQETTPPKVKVTPDFDTISIHVGSDRVRIPNDRLLEVVEALAYWLTPCAADVKALLMKLAMQNGIYAEDVFPAQPLVVTALIEEADQYFQNLEVQQ